MTYLALSKMVQNGTQPKKITYRGDTYAWDAEEKAYLCGHKWLLDVMGDVMSDWDICNADVIEKAKENEDVIPVSWITEWYKKALRLANDGDDVAVDRMLDDWRKEKENGN